MAQRCKYCTNEQTTSQQTYRKTPETKGIPLIQTTTLYNVVDPDSFRMSHMENGFLESKTVWILKKGIINTEYQLGLFPYWSMESLMLEI